MRQPIPHGWHFVSLATLQLERSSLLGASRVIGRQSYDRLKMAFGLCFFWLCWKKKVEHWPAEEDGKNKLDFTSQLFSCSFWSSGKPMQLKSNRAINLRKIGDAFFVYFCLHFTWHTGEGAVNCYLCFLQTSYFAVTWSIYKSFTDCGMTKWGFIIMMRNNGEKGMTWLNRW